MSDLADLGGLGDDGLDGELLAELGPGAVLAVPARGELHGEPSVSVMAISVRRGEAHEGHFGRAESASLTSDEGVVGALGLVRWRGIRTVA